MKCYVCGSESWLSIPGSLRDAPTIGIVGCEGCGVEVAEGPHGIVVDYESGSMHGGRPIEDDHEDSITASDLDRRVSRVSQGLQSQDVILEIGSGAGSFLGALKEKQLIGIGIEIDRSARDRCARRGLDTRTSIHDLSPKERESVQVCAMFHVLEHLTDPRTLIGEIVDLLPNLKRLFIEVPCADDPLLKLYGCKEFTHFTYWSHHEHLHTTFSLALVAALDGFDTRIERFQRYGLANHIGWIANGLPGGHVTFASRVNPESDHRYRRMLLEAGYSDTLWCELTNLSNLPPARKTSFCFDIDGTLCSITDGNYLSAVPFESRISHVNGLHENGHRIVLYTARGSTSGIDWTQQTQRQLSDWGVRYDELYFRKPFADVHVDDKAVNSDVYEW